MQGGAIGVFDSGVGGLTVVRALRALLPSETILYLGDTARVPYGTKSRATVQRYSLENIKFLETVADELGQRHAQASLSRAPSPFCGLKLVVVACNTATAFALDTLRERCSIPVLGVIRSAVRRALQLTQQRTIGVIGTEGTIRSGAYQRAIAWEDPSAEVLVQPCPLLVPLAEEGWLEHPVTDMTLQTYLGGWKQGQVDTLVLGCTHYPLFHNALDRLFEGKVELVDSSSSVAQEAVLVLQKRGWLAPAGQQGKLICFVTDAPDRFQRIASRFLGEAPQCVEQVDLMQFVRGTGGQKDNDHGL